MAHTLCVSYDLPEDSDYSEVIDYLKQFKGWWHHLESTWFVVTSKSAAEVRDDLSDRLPNGGKVIVFAVSVGSRWATSGIPERGATWLTKHFGSD